MKKLLNQLIGVSVAAFFLVISMTIGIESANAAPSTFQNSCSQISVEVTGRPQPVLKAVCLKRDGSPKNTCLGLRGIDNIDGNLQQGSLAKFSTFHLTCSSASINEDILSASCLKINQSNNPTTLALQNIENIDGTLQYSN